VASIAQAPASAYRLAVGGAALLCSPTHSPPAELVAFAGSACEAVYEFEVRDMR